MLWSEEQVADLKRRWAANETAREIGTAIGVGRNAVLGKIHRLGLSTRVNRKPVHRVEHVGARRNGGAIKSALKAKRAREREIAARANQSPLANVMIARARAMGELPACEEVELPTEQICREPVALVHLLLHIHAANVRRDFHHKISTDLARSNALIAVGNVNSKQLAQTRMAKSVLDAGWSAFRQMLAYKSAVYVEVDEKFTTQTCAECGSIAGPKGQAGLNKREWMCDCGATHDRDVNSARNILARALSAERPVLESRRAA